MPELKDRMKHEGRIARALGKQHRESLEAALAHIGEAPQRGSLPPELWDALNAGYAAILAGELEKVFLTSGTAYAETVAFTVEALPQQAAEWGNSYVQKFVAKMTETSRLRYDKAIQDFVNVPLDLKTLRERLGSIFGPSRA